MALVSRTVDSSKLNQRIVSKFEQYPEIIEVLDRWILFPNAALVDELEKIAPEVRKIQPPHLPDYLYRGFSTLGHQETFGFVNVGWFRNKVKTGLYGQSTSLRLEKPVSFTTNKDIARGFGSNILSTTSKGVLQHSIWVSDEICYLVAMKRKHKIVESQDEVIVLPSLSEIELTLQPPEPTSKSW